MTIRKTVFSGMAIVATVMFLFAGCDISVFVWDPSYNPDPQPETGLEFTLEWKDSAADDPHLFITYPAPDDGYTTDDNGAPEFTEPYLPILDAGGDFGFQPLDQPFGVPIEATDDRGAVYYADTRSSFDIGFEPAIELTDTSSSSETILVRAFPFEVPAILEVSTTGGNLTGLPYGTYTWVGVMEVYVYATSGQIAYTNGDGVDAVLTVTQDGVPVFSYVFPENTYIKGSTVIRINLFFDEDGNEIYQLNLDARQIQQTSQIRSVLTSGESPVSEPVVIRVPRA